MPATMPMLASITAVMPCSSMCCPASATASRSRASDGGGSRSWTSRIARSWNSPVSLPSLRPSAPPSGSGVLCPTPASAIAAWLATSIWPQVRRT